MSKISLKHSGGNVVSLNSPTNAPSAADVAFKLPNADGTSGQALVTDASGNLSFAGTGKILQVVSTTKTDTTSSTSSSFANMTGMAVTITPSSASSKIYLTGYFSLGINDARYRIYLKITGGNCSNYIGDAGTGIECANIARLSTQNVGNHQLSTTLMFLDSPNTASAITYQVQWAVQSSQTAYLNRDHNDDADRGNTASTFTAMEVAA